MTNPWPTTKLGDVIDLFDSQRIPLNSRQRQERQGKFPYYGAQGIIDYIDDYIFDGRYILVAEDGENLNSKKLPLALFATGKFWVNNHAHILRGKANIADDTYLLACLNNADIKPFVTGAAQPKLSQGNLRLIEIPLPPLPIQQRIAGILSAYDELIENSQRRIKLLEAMARALYREWFVHFRFPGHENHPRVPSPLGEIPQGWEVRTVEEIVKRIPVGKKYDQKTVSSTGTIPVLDQGKSGIIGFHDEQPGVEATESTPVIVFANHTCYQRLIHFPFSAIQNVLPFVSHPSVFRNIYWLHWVTNGLVAFNDYKGHWPEFAAKWIVVPPQDICQDFGNFAETISRQILKLERAIQTLRRTRDLLLPRLLSGQIDVKTIPYA